MPEVGGWKPFHETHAIQSAAVSVAFSEPVGDVTWRKGQAVVSPIAESLGLLEQSPIGPTLPAELQALGIKFPIQQGVAYTRKTENDALGERFQLTRDTLRFEDFDYVRWLPFKRRAGELISQAAAMYSDVSSVSKIQSEYMDIFEAVDPTAPSDSRNVINIDSSIVARQAVGGESNWHCHSGWFEGDNRYFRRLVNVNIDVVDQPRDRQLDRVIRIHTLIIDQFGEQAGRQVIDQTLDWARLEPQLDSAHRRLKELLQEVITPQAAEAISLS